MAPVTGTGKTGRNSAGFKGPILFINHDAENMTAEPHRHEVFTHVQNNYRRWKRREEAKLIRSHAKVPASSQSATRVSRQTSKGSNTSSRSSQGSSGGEALSVDSSKSSSSGTEDTETELVEINQAIDRAGSRLSAPREGNSDPFNSYPFKLDAQANQLINFYRDFVIPSIYHTGSGRRSVTEASALRDFNDTIDGLQDAGGAYSFLAKNAFTASHHFPAMRQRGAMYQGMSTRLLMEKVAKGQEVLQSQKTLWHINNLWQAETIEGNLAGALAHGRMLRHLFEEQAKAGNLDFKFLLYVIYTDCHMSATFLIKPVFDVEIWLPKVLAPIWKQASAAAAAYLPPLPDSLHDLDPSIDDLELKSIFIGRRETSQLFISSASADQEIPHSTLVLAWIAYRAIVSQGRTINFYLNKKYESRMSNITEENRDSLYAHQYTALAALYISRHWSFNNNILGQPMFNAGPKILAVLREVLEESERLPGDAHFHKYNNARLWALYVGATGERVGAGPRIADAELSQKWFHRRLAEQAFVLDLKSWKAAREVLKRFLYTDIIPPNGKDWFETNLDHSGLHGHSEADVQQEG